VFKNLVAKEKWEEASEIVRRQMRVGTRVWTFASKAHSVMIKRHPPFYEKLIRKGKPPMMIDTTDRAFLPKVRSGVSMLVDSRR
jgi:hypothetical protein